MPYRHVLLDLDHTLLDTERSLALAFEAAMQAVDVPAAGHYATFNEINHRLWRKVEAQELSPPEVHIARFEQLVEQLGLAADPQVMGDAFAHGMGAHGDLYEGARELLEVLRATTTMALVTNGLSGIQRARIDRLELEQYFDAITISAEVGCAKPGTEIFDITFAALGEPDRADAIMVGDNLASDILGGKNAGIATCWYNPSAAATGADPTPTHQVAHLPDVAAIVLGH